MPRPLKNLSIPVTATIGGSYTSPKVSTDLTSGVSNLTRKLVAIQKNQLISQGKNQIKDIMDGLIGGNTQQKDSVSSETKNPVKDILGGFLGGKKKD